MKMTFIVFCYFFSLNTAIAADSIIWQKEISINSNSSCQPGAMMVDKKNNEVIILGAPVERDTKEPVFLLWKMDPNGNIKQKRPLGLVSKNKLLAAVSLGMKAVVKPDTGDIIRLNMSDDDSNSISLSIIGSNMQYRAVKFDVSRKRSQVFQLNDMTSYQNENLLFAGQENQNGIIMKTDLAGNVIWRKIFDISQTNILSSIACTPDGMDFYVTGLSFTMTANMTFSEHYKVRILRYDENGEIKAKDFFDGGIIPFPTILPKVLCLPSGIVLVVNDKNNKSAATQLYVNAYTAELKPLYEKQIFTTKETSPPAYFDVCPAGQNRFVLAVVTDTGDLKVFEYDADAKILQTIELDGAVSGSSIFVDYVGGKIFAAFAARPKANEKKTSIKLLALQPYKTN